MVDKIAFSKQLEGLIDKRGLNRKQLAERARISRASLYNLLNGDVAESRLSTLIRLAGALEVHPMELLKVYFETLVPAHRLASSTPEIATDFVGDISYPDFSSVFINETFTKTWAVINTGTTPWENLWLECQNLPTCHHGFPIGLNPTQRRIPIPFTAPGEQLQISAELTAPSLPSTSISEWKTVNSQGELIFPDKVSLYCLVRVISL